MWMTYEKYIRKAAGLGKSPLAIDPDFYDKTYAHCDVLVTGGGPAGIQAASAAAQTGAKSHSAGREKRIRRVAFERKLSNHRWWRRH